MLVKRREWFFKNRPEKRVMFHCNLPETFGHFVTWQLELVTDGRLVRLQITISSTHQSIQSLHTLQYETFKQRV